MDNAKLEIVKRFAREIMDENDSFTHNWDHVVRVADNALKAIELLKAEKKVDRAVLIAACYLHDSATVNRPFTLYRYFFESKYVRQVLPGILNRLEVDKDEAKTILDAAVNHPLSIPWRKLNKNKDLYSRILQDADSLDYFSTARTEAWLRECSQGYRRIYYYPLKLYFYLGRRLIGFFLNEPGLAELLA